jgi:hypothetical protein
MNSSASRVLQLEGTVTFGQFAMFNVEDEDKASQRHGVCVTVGSKSRSTWSKALHRADIDPSAFDACGRATIARPRCGW